MVVATARSIAVNSVPTEEVPSVWPAVKDWIWDGHAHSDPELTIEDIYESLCKSRMQLWIGHDDDGIVIALTTEVIDMPAMRICRLVSAGGTKDGSVEYAKEKARCLLEAVREWAKSIGCTRIETYCRDAMKRIWEGHGMKKVYNVMRMEV